MEFQVLIDNGVLFGNGILEGLHFWDDSIGGLLRFLSFLGHNLGSNMFFMVLLSLTYILFSPKLGLAMAWGLLTSGILNSLAKFYFKSPRPFGLDPAIAELQDSAGEFAFGFPSGHVHTAVVIWGLIFWYIKWKPLRYLSIFLISLMPFSRMYVGVHFLGDVIGGAIMGLLNLVLIIWFVNRYPDFPSISRFDANPRIARTYILATLAISLSPVLLFDTGLQPPEIHSLNTTIISAAALAGALIGLILLKIGSFKNRLDWEVVSGFNTLPLSTVGIRLGILILSVGLFYIIPSVILKSFSWGDDILVRYMRYLLVGFFIVYLIPNILFRIQDGIYLKSNSNG